MVAGIGGDAQDPRPAYPGTGRDRRNVGGLSSARRGLSALHGTTEVKNRKPQPNGKERLGPLLQRPFRRGSASASLLDPPRRSIALVGAAAQRTEILLPVDDDASRAGRETVGDGGIAAQPATDSAAVGDGKVCRLDPGHRNEGDVVLLIEPRECWWRKVSGRTRSPGSSAHRYSRAPVPW
jgi:hypothetical protein